MDNKLLLDRQRRQRDAKRFFLLWMRRLIIGYVLCMGIYFVWLFAIQGVTIDYVGNVQKKYGKFLVEQNDVFIEYMVEFEGLTSKTKAVYTEGEKEAIRDNLNKQNEFLKKMQQRAPNEKNSDYIDIYQDMLQIYAFYIQGEVMKAEYCYQYTDNFTLENSFSGSSASLESYTMGQELCNMMGNMILNNVKYINDVRDTTYSSKYNIVEIGNSTNKPSISGGNTNEGNGSNDTESSEDVTDNNPDNNATDNTSGNNQNTTVPDTGTGENAGSDSTQEEGNDDVSE